METQQAHNIPPSRPIDKNKILNIINQLPKPYLLAGDFNAHHPTWGSTPTNEKGKIIEDIILHEDIVILNTGDPTHFSTQHGSFSAIDLSFSTPENATTYTWEPLDDLHDSDHYPIRIETHPEQTRTHQTTQQLNFKSQLDRISELHRAELLSYPRIYRP
jgi:hypothetical protein